MGVTVIGVDGGNSKTDLVVATLDGTPVAYVRGPGSNSHGLGAEGCVDVLTTLLRQVPLEAPAEQAALFLCGADVPADVSELADAVRRRDWARGLTIENDTWALLWTGATRTDSVAVVCGAGINCVGHTADGRRTKRVSLGWETGDWGGADDLGRAALHAAARAEDGRGDATELVEILRRHFDVSTVADVGAAIHYRRLPQPRLGELAPAVVEAAEGGDRVARALLDRLVEEIALLAIRALRELELLTSPADVVLGGGMLSPGSSLVEEVAAHLVARAPLARVAVVEEPPVLGATLAALNAAGAAPDAEQLLRAAFRAGLEPDDLR